MKSLQTKFIMLITSALLTLSLFVGGFSIWNANRVVLHDSEQMMESSCTEQALRLDNQLERIEQAVTTIYHYALGQLTSMNQLKDLNVRKKYTDKVRVVALDIANNTEGAMAVYFRYDPALTDGTSGFFWSKPDVKGRFEYNPPTDLSVYEKDDVEHVGWFYQPVEKGRSMWMSPYMNQNIGVEMISYVVPFFFEDKLVGVIGMDIDFTLLVDLAQEVVLYENGHANLIDMSKKTIYYREAGDDAVTVHEATIPDILFEDLSASKSNMGSLKNYRSQNVTYKMAFETVKNGMKYILYAPASEINARRNQLLTGIILLTVFILLMFIIFTSYMTKKIIQPLRELNEAAGQMAEGNLEVSLECKSEDEIGTLTRSVNVMADKLEKYLKEINAQAYRDGLTGVKNKAFYMEYIEKLAEETEAVYAVSVFDVNNLKGINDTYGHEQGDDLIVTACKYICYTFTHSPVFRIGGDEFVTILRGSDFEDREQLFAQFMENMGQQKMSMEPFASLSVAYGISVRENGQTYDEVFRLADQKMYQKKKEMKHGVEPR